MNDEQNRGAEKEKNTLSLNSCFSSLAHRVGGEFISRGGVVLCCRCVETHTMTQRGRSISPLDSGGNREMSTERKERMFGP